MTPAAHIPHGPATTKRRRLELYLKSGDSNRIAQAAYAELQLVCDLLSGTKPVGDGDPAHLRILRVANRESRLNKVNAFGGPKLRHLVVEMSDYMHGLVTQCNDALA